MGSRGFFNAPVLQGGRPVPGPGNCARCATRSGPRAVSGSSWSRRA